MSPLIEKILIGLLVGLILLLIGLRATPAVAKAQKKREAAAAAAELRHREERKLELDRLNAQWSRNRDALSRVGEFLKSFNQMDRYPDNYHAKVCERLAEVIEIAARQIVGEQFEGIKTKLLEYAGRRKNIHANSDSNELRALFQRSAGQVYEPFALWQEAQEVLKRTKVPPFSAEDV